MTRVLVDARNLRHGGAVSVATSQVSEIVRGFRSGEFSWISSLEVCVSSRIASELDPSLLTETSSSYAITVLNSKGWSEWLRFDATYVDVRYTVFGPTYGPRIARTEVCGFADGSIIPISGVEIRPSLRLLERAKRRIKLLSLWKYDGFIVQSDRMRMALGEVVSATIAVEPNIPGMAFRTRSSRAWTLPESTKGATVLFYPARGYEHKNHQFLPRICKEVENLTGKPCLTVITLRHDEVERLGLENEPHLINVGEISANDCADLYRSTDALIFPSLNETVSSAPLEAMLIGVPVIASNLPPIVEASGGLGFYFEPNDETSAGRAVVEALSEKGINRILRARHWSHSLGSPREQASRIVTLLESFSSRSTRSC